MQAKERLQKLLAGAGICSRRRAEELIVSGAVTVNGEIVRELGVAVVPGVDVVVCGGKTISAVTRKIYRFNKPPGVISTLRDPRGRRCLREFVEEIGLRVFPVGRLDIDVRGLLLLTNDGDYAQRLLHPRYQVPRCYFAAVEGCPSVETIAAMLAGIRLEDGVFTAGAAEILDSKIAFQHFPSLRRGWTGISLTVHVGRKHFVKRFLKAAGHPVIELCRVAFGPYQIGELCPGEMVESPFLSLN